MLNAKYIKISVFVFLALNIISYALYSTAQENSSSTKNIFQDTDQDGLSDEEEKTYGTNPLKGDSDGDSYSDGTEVSSGYDPLKPAPGDKIVTSAENNSVSEPKSGSDVIGETSSGSEEENLTQDLTKQVATMLQNSQTENKDISVDDLDTIVNGLVEENLTFDDLPEISQDEIKIKKVSYKGLDEEEKTAKQKEVALEYLSAVSYVMMNNSPTVISTAQDVNKLGQEIEDQMMSFAASLNSPLYFEKFIGSADSSYKELEKIEVPEEYVQMHLRGMGILKQASMLRDVLNVNAQTDPIAAIVQLSKVQSLLVLSNQLYEEAASEFGKYQIEF